MENKLLNVNKPTDLYCIYSVQGLLELTDVYLWGWKDRAAILDNDSELGRVKFSEEEDN